MIDIVLYRQRIGCFISAKQPKFKCKSKADNKYSFILNFLLLFICITTSDHQNVNNIDTKYNAEFNKYISPLNCNNNPLAEHVNNPSLNIYCGNAYAHYINGNISNKSAFNIVHWNKGNAYLENKKDEIDAVIEKYKPHILGLSEANLRHETDLQQVQFEDFDLHTCPTITNPDIKMSRIVVYTHKSLVVKPRPDLMDNTLSTIWLEVGLPGKKKILICNIYREWGYMRQNDNISHSDNAQLTRWSRFIELWQQALSEDKETIVIGDVNIDCLKWGEMDDILSTDKIYKQKPLIKLLFENIFPSGVSQLINVPTRFCPGQEPSGLDHIYSNKPEKLSNITAHTNGGSDHKVLQVLRHAKSLQMMPRYVRKRCYKNFDAAAFQEDVNKVKWYNVYASHDANTATELLSSMFTETLNRHAPVKTIQINKKYAPWLTESTKHMMSIRDQAHQRWSETKSQNDWETYTKLRNSTTEVLRKAKEKWEANSIDVISNKLTDVWQNLKSLMKWNTKGPPLQLMRCSQPKATCNNHE